jgi:hypothetical protein
MLGRGYRGAVSFTGDLAGCGTAVVCLCRVWLGRLNKHDRDMEDFKPPVGYRPMALVGASDCCVIGPRNRSFSSMVRPVTQCLSSEAKSA